jgi:hypothetical protein
MTMQSASQALRHGSVQPSGQAVRELGKGIETLGGRAQRMLWEEQDAVLDHGALAVNRHSWMVICLHCYCSPGPSRQRAR